MSYLDLLGVASCENSYLFLGADGIDPMMIHERLARVFWLARIYAFFVLPSTVLL